MHRLCRPVALAALVALTAHGGLPVVAAGGRFASTLAGARRSPFVPPRPCAGTLLVGADDTPSEDFVRRFFEALGSGPAHVIVLSSERASNATLPAPWPTDRPVEWITAGAALEQPSVFDGAAAVWIQARESAPLADPAIARVLQRLLSHGGVIAVSGAAVRLVGEWALDASGAASHAVPWGLLPRAVVARRDPAAPPDALRARLLEQLGGETGSVGYLLASATELTVRGRRIFVGGRGGVTVCLPRSPTRPARTDFVATGRPIDFIAMSRAAAARGGPRFPPADPQRPRVAAGTLVIVGGGTTPEIVRRFIAAAGGPEAARIVVIPTAIGEPGARQRDFTRFLRNAGAAHVETLHATTPRDADGAASLALLRDATGLWFTGGRQWRLVDAYAGSEALRLMHGILERGGVIGGSSAGATIQGDYLVRGNPLGNRDMMAEGYERGFAFLPGVAIDQHFRQRDRFADMEQLKRVFPQLVGLGIDEQTAAVMSGDVLEVIGRHRVTIFERPAAERAPEPLALRTGQRYEFDERRMVEGF